MELLSHILDAFISTLKDLLPIVAVLVGFQFFVLRRPIPNFRRVFTGFVYVLVGMTLFLEGLREGLFPLGRLMASQLTDPAFMQAGTDDVGAPVYWADYLWVYLFASMVGAGSAIAEPSLIAIATKANKVSGGAIGVWGLRLAVAAGVAIGLALGTFRIVSGLPIHYFIIAGYLVVVVQTWFAPRTIIPLAYDSGGVTTSTVTVPLVAALGLGLAEAIPGRNALIDGFGLIAFACLFPVISVMAYAQITVWVERRTAQRFYAAERRGVERRHKPRYGKDRRSINVEFKTGESDESN